MTVQLFQFERSLFPECSEHAEYFTTKDGLSGGNDQRRSEWGDSEDYKLRAVFALWFPQTSYDIGDWHQFVYDHRGSGVGFIYPPYTDFFRVVTDVAVGTGDGTTTAFSLPDRYIDASTLAVEVSGTPTSVTLSGNNDDPTVTFSVAPSASAPITASYERRFLANLVADGYPVPLKTGHTTDATRRSLLSRIEVVSSKAGSHRNPSF